MSLRFAKHTEADALYISHGNFQIHVPSVIHAY